MEQRIGEIVEGALAAVAPVAFVSRPVVVRAPRADIAAVATGALQWAILPLSGFYAATKPDTLSEVATPHSGRSMSYTKKSPFRPVSAYDTTVSL